MPEKLYPMRGRDNELARVVQAWNDVLGGSPRYVRIAGEPGAGKTRLAQALYQRLTKEHDPATDESPEGYWPDLLRAGQTGTNLVPTYPAEDAELPPMPFFWWALSCPPRDAPDVESLLPYSDGLRQIHAHVGGMMRAKFRGTRWAEAGAVVRTGGLADLPGVGIVMSAINAIDDIRKAHRKLREAEQKPEYEARELVEVSGGSHETESKIVALLSALSDAAEVNLPTVPIIVVIDDIQWAGQRAVALTCRLLERAAEEGWKLLILSTVRVNELIAQQRTIASGTDVGLARTAAGLEDSLIRRLGDEVVVPVSLAHELSEEAVRGILRDHLPGNATARTVSALSQRAGGQPYYAVNYAKLVKEQGWVNEAGELTVGDEELKYLPGEIEAIIDRRLDILAPQRKRVLMWASVQGRHFMRDLIASVAQRMGIPEGAALAELDVLGNGHGLISRLPDSFFFEERFYEFSHQLVHERAVVHFPSEREEHAQVRDCLGELLRDCIDEWRFWFWPPEVKLDALRFLYDYARERKRRRGEADEDGWERTELRAAGMLIDLMREKGLYREAEPIADQVWCMVQNPSTWITDDPQFLIGMLHSLEFVFDIRGRRDEQLGTAQRLLEVARSMDDETAVAQALQILGMAYCDRGNENEALELLESALVMMESRGDEDGIAAALHNLGWVHMVRGEDERALPLLQRALEIEQRLDDELGVSMTQYYLASLHMYRGDLESAKELYESALEAAQRLGDEIGAAKTMNSMGILHGHLREYDVALKLYGQSLAVKRRLGDEAGTARTLDCMASAEYNRKEYAHALECSEQGLELWQRIGDQQEIAGSFQFMAATYWESASRERALDLYGRALRIWEQLGAEKEIAAVYQSMAAICAETGDSERAVSYCEQASLVLEQRGADEDIVAAYYEIGALYSDLGDHERGLLSFERSLHVAQRLESEESAAWASYAMSSECVDLGKYTRAESLCSNALALFKNLGAEEGTAWALAMLGWVLLLLGRLEESITSSKEAFELEDDLMTHCNASHAKWLLGDVDAVDHYRAGMDKYGALPVEFLKDFDLLIENGLTSRDDVDRLLRDLGIVRT